MPLPEQGLALSGQWDVLAGAAVTQCHRRVGLLKRNLSFPQSWRLEVQGQSVSGPVPPGSHSPRHVDGRLLPVSSHGRPPVCLCPDLLVL